MAIALDTATDSGASQYTGASPLTFSHTCTGTNLILFVCVRSGSGSAPSAVTYNGVSLTQINSRTDGSTDSLWYLINPATGSNTVSISFSATNIIACAVSYTGVNQSGQPDASATNVKNNSSTWDGTVTTIADNCWTIAVAHANQGGTLSAGANTTKRTTITTNFIVGDSNSAKTPAGSVTLNFSTNAGAGDNWAGCIASFSPVSPSIDISIFESVTVSEAVTMMEDLNPNINDSVTVTEAVTMGLENNINVSESVTVTENVTMMINLNPSVSESITVSESVTGNVDLNPSVSDSITVTENIETGVDNFISVFEDITVSENVAIDTTFLSISVSESVVVSEGVTMMMDLNPSVSDSITVTESAGTTVWAAIAGLVHLRSKQQNTPIGMDNTGPISMRSKQQNTPLPMDNNEIL